MAEPSVAGVVMPVVPIAVVTLHIGRQQTVATTRSGGAEDSTLTLALGWGAVPATLFRHDPPTPGEIENAIMAVEDVVMPALPRMVPGAVLVTSDPVIREIAVLAGVAGVADVEGVVKAEGAAPDVVLDLEALERVFDRFSAIVQGRPPSQDVLPPGPAFAATLLILREFMHHLKFAAITIESGPAA